MYHFAALLAFLDIREMTKNRPQAKDEVLIQHHSS